jgi:hypothetical protein
VTESDSQPLTSPGPSPSLDPNPLGRGGHLGHIRPSRAAARPRPACALARAAPSHSPPWQTPATVRSQGDLPQGQGPPLVHKGPRRLPVFLAPREKESEACATYDPGRTNESERPPDSVVPWSSSGNPQQETLWPSMRGKQGWRLAMGMLVSALTNVGTRTSSSLLQSAGLHAYRGHGALLITVITEPSKKGM